VILEYPKISVERLVFMMFETVRMHYRGRLLIEGHKHMIEEEYFPFDR